MEEDRQGLPWKIVTVSLGGMASDGISEEEAHLILDEHSGGAGVQTITGQLFQVKAWKVQRPWGSNHSACIMFVKPFPIQISFTGQCTPSMIVASNSQLFPSLDRGPLPNSWFSGHERSLTTFVFNFYWKWSSKAILPSQNSKRLSESSRWGSISLEVLT